MTELTGLISYILIGISVIVSLIVWKQKDLFRYGMNPSYLATGDYRGFAKQMVLFQFIHGDMLHLVMNSYFLYSAGPVLERVLGVPLFLIFFLVTTLVSVGALLIFARKSNTIGISGFCMALLAYLSIGLYSVGDPAAGEIGTLLLINIALGIIPGISLVGHVAGAITGFLFWFFTRSLL